MNNTGYTSGYPTQYSGCTNKEVVLLFSTDNWNRMDYGQRVDACQEMANRFAVANNTSPVRVTTAPMIGSTYGYEQRNTITLNDSLLRDGVFKTEDVDENGKDVIVDLKVDAANWNILDTVSHEYTHALQEAQGRMAQTYIEPGKDYDLYRIQADEKEAFATGQNFTLKAIDVVEQSSGQPDSGATSYRTTVNNESFQESLDRARLNYNDYDVENTLNQVIHDRDNGVYRANTSDSYEAINKLCDEGGLWSSQGKEGSHSQVIDDGGSLMGTGSASGVTLGNDGGGLTQDGFDAGASEDGASGMGQSGQDTGGYSSDSGGQEPC